VENYNLDIKVLRKKYGLNQTEFADKLGITREMVGQMERGNRKVSKSTKILLDNFIKENKVPDVGNLVQEDQALYKTKRSVVIDDAASEMLHKIMSMEAMLRIVLNSQAEILAQQRGESVSKVLSEFSKAVNDETLISFSELQHKG
jgi:transcriptional regulator with XRE-family HTH domain